MLIMACSRMSCPLAASRQRQKSVRCCCCMSSSFHGGLSCCRACQTVLAALAARLLPALAPVLPHMAEDAWQHLPWPQPAASVFQVSAPAAAARVQWLNAASIAAVSVRWVANSSHTCRRGQRCLW